MSAREQSNKERGKKDQPAGHGRTVHRDGVIRGDCACSLRCPRTNHTEARAGEMRRREMKCASSYR